MKVITAPERINIPWLSASIFLAGSIEQGKARDWQEEAIAALKAHPQSSDLAVLNPRRRGWDPSWDQSPRNQELRTQVEWELEGLEMTDFVFFYFQGETLSPISLLELGKASASHMPGIVVCEPSFWRLANVDVTARRANMQVATTFEEGLQLLLRARF